MREEGKKVFEHPGRTNDNERSRIKFKVRNKRKRLQFDKNKTNKKNS